MSRGVRFYTGTPSAERSPMWHGYWERRLLAMRRAGITVYSRPIRYRTETIHLPDGNTVERRIWPREGNRLAARLGCCASGCSWRARCGRDLQPRPGSGGGGGRDPCHLSFAGPVAEGCVCVPVGCRSNHSPRNRQDRLVSHRSGNLRCMPRPSRLSAEGHSNKLVWLRACLS